MRCPNCGHLMLKLDISKYDWKCGTCKAAYYMLQTHAPEIEVNDEQAKEKWYKIVMAQYEELRRLGFDVPTGFIDFSLAFAFIKEDGLLDEAE